MKWYLKVLQNYTNFQGRARRKEYWFFVLFNLIFAFAISIVGYILAGETGADLLNGLYSLAILLPSLAVGARRLHDIDRSGWWQLIMLIPLVGIIILIVFFATDGNNGDNRFGSDPKLEPEPGTGY